MAEDREMGGEQFLGGSGRGLPFLHRSLPLWGSLSQDIAWRQEHGLAEHFPAPRSFHGNFTTDAAIIGHHCKACLVTVAFQELCAFM